MKIENLIFTRGLIVEREEVDIFREKLVQTRVSTNGGKG